MDSQPPDDGARRSQGHPSTTTSTTTTTHGAYPYQSSTTTTLATSGGQGTSVMHFGTHSTTITHPTITTTTHTPNLQPPASSATPSRSNSQRNRSGSIRIRRPSTQNLQPSPPAQPEQTTPAAVADDGHWQTGRRRSSSEPRPPPSALFADDNDLRRQMTATPLQPLYEESSRPGNAGGGAPGAGPPVSQGLNARRQGLTRQTSALNIRRNNHHRNNDNMMDANVVDVLDVIDPEISTLTTLNNVQNSLFLPNLPWLYNRQPTYDLGQQTSDSSDEEMGPVGREKSQRDDLPPITQEGEIQRAAGGRGLSRVNTIDSILSTMDEGPEHHYAVLPHGASLPGWTNEEKAILDDHVRHVLHSKRAKFKRTMRGFGRYVRNPLGFIVTLYFFLITFWGAAWVLFLIGWIYVKGRQQYFVEICDQVLTALFCVVGITMFPFRIVDTYHMAFVAKYAHKTWRLRKERGLAALKDHNELPRQSMAVDNREEIQAEIEDEVEEELPVLTEEEQKKLEYHQSKLAKSHTFYRPTETYTHHAFSIRLLITIVVLLDCHSMFQCALGGTTWGIYYKDRPKALTAVILSCSLTCNITAGIIIGRGDKRSRKKLVVEQLLRQEITEEALRKMRKERGLKAKGLMTKGQKKNVEKQMGQKKKSPLDTILHRG